MSVVFPIHYHTMYRIGSLLILNTSEKNNEHTLNEQTPNLFIEQRKIRNNFQLMSQRKCEKRKKSNIY